MNIITGINKFQVSGFKFQVKSAEGIVRLILFSTLMLWIVGCTSRQQAAEKEVAARTDVKVSSPSIGNADQIMNFQAVTHYMQDNNIRTKLTGIITQINCVVAGNIRTGQSLFVIQPQEAAALQKSKFNNQIISGLSDTVYSNLSGQIKSLNVQVGDFVQAGDVLANCIRANSMRIIAYIPVEKESTIEKMKNCKVILPDGTSVDGKISGKLPSADAQNQTQSYIIEPNKPVMLAENINLSVQFAAEQLKNVVFVPESAVLGNEEQTRFWIMKLINDSLCTKVAVEKGLKKDSLIQLINSGLTSTDRIIIEGGYGLPDSARIQVIHKN